MSYWLCQAVYFWFVTHFPCFVHSKNLEKSPSQVRIELAFLNQDLEILLLSFFGKLPQPKSIIILTTCLSVCRDHEIILTSCHFLYKALMLLCEKKSKRRHWSGFGDIVLLFCGWSWALRSSHNTCQLERFKKLLSRGSRCPCMPSWWNWSLPAKVDWEWIEFKCFPLTFKGAHV